MKEGTRLTRTSVGLAAVILVISLAGAVWAAQAAAKLIVNGKVASADVKVIGGRAYAPLGDIAKALGMVVVKKGGAYELTAAGGTYQVEGSGQGKIGDELFTGKWRFQVLGLREVSQYTERYYEKGNTIQPKGKNDTLIVIDCRIKNALKQTQSPVLTERMPINTALADDSGRSYAPIDYDARQAMDKVQSYEAEALLPGAAADFALVFSVPKGTRPKDLVFTCLTYYKPHEAKDVRVSLQR